MLLECYIFIQPIKITYIITLNEFDECLEYFHVCLRKLRSYDSIDKIN